MKKCKCHKYEKHPVTLNEHRELKWVTIISLSNAKQWKIPLTDVNEVVAN